MSRAVSINNAAVCGFINSSEYILYSFSIGPYKTLASTFRLWHLVGEIRSYQQYSLVNETTVATPQKEAEASTATAL